MNVCVGFKEKAGQLSEKMLQCQIIVMEPDPVGTGTFALAEPELEYFLDSVSVTKLQ
jgi:hypothetical protein